MYLHGGRAYEVEQLDLATRRALVRPFEGDWYTQAKRETDMYIERLDDRREWLGVTLSFGTVVVTEQVVAYQTRRLADHEVLDLVALDLPQTSFSTQALWYELPEAVVLGRRCRSTRCSARCTPPSTPRSPCSRCWRCATAGTSAGSRRTTTRRPGGPTIFIYDGHPGGIGITRRGFLAFDALVDDAHRLIGECPCEKGCPSCVQSPKCGNLNEPLSKLGAAELMGRMLAFERQLSAAHDPVQRWSTSGAGTDTWPDMRGVLSLACALACPRRPRRRRPVRGPAVPPRPRPAAG